MSTSTTVEVYDMTKEMFDQLIANPEKHKEAAIQNKSATNTVYTSE